MYDVALKEIDRQLRRLHDENDGRYIALKNSWRSARNWSTTKQSPSQGTPILVPYIGSGLNRLVDGGLGSWEDLVKKVALASRKQLGSEHQVKRSGLTLPQQLEIYLRTAATHDDAGGSVFEALRAALGQQGQPSSFHKRLAKMFPVLLTTNYNDILAVSDPSKKVIDLTAPNCNPDLTTPCICHLHGRWDAAMQRKDLEPKIFGGVGKHDGSVRPCLVLTENQYHRLYSDSDFKDALTKILGPPHILLFLGASLASDEAGIHHILTARQLAEEETFSGLYVGVNMDPLKEQLLALRGIQCINLRKNFGISKFATETLFHALFDQMEKSFGSKRIFLASPTPNLPGPEILCIGLAAWNRILSLGSKKSIGTETSHDLLYGTVLEEAGGQHLAPALHLVRYGRRVALATTTGDDALGDQLKQWLARHLEGIMEHAGNGDLIEWTWETKGSTRLTTVVTYGGTRVIFDYDGEGLGTLHAPRIDWEQWTSLNALYFGYHYLDFEETLLKELHKVKWKFFETGTRGPSDEPSFERAVNLAKQCTHVLSSSEFALRLAGRTRVTTKKKTLDCQRRLYENYLNGNGTIVRDALKRLWPNPKNRKNLIIVMGGYGSLIATRAKVHYRPATTVEDSQGRSWLGCGDIFRGEFIHQILDGANCVSAAKAATNVVAEKIKRVSFYP